MADKYVVTGTTNPSRSGTEEVVFEKDENDNVTKSISKTQPAELSKEEKGTLDSLGVTYEKVSADEATAIEEGAAQTSAVASDTAGAAPTFEDKPQVSTPTDKKGAGSGSGSGDSK
jgi:hypothetical protein